MPKFEKWAQAHVVPIHAPSVPGSGRRGHSLVQDIRREWPDSALRTVFDVGANVGERSLEFASEFPDAEVYCFEPVATTCEILARELGRLARCRCFQLGFGDVPGTVNMLSNLAHPNRSYVLPDGEQGAEKIPDRAAEIVEARMDTIDRFCARHGIAHIDLLKIDTEGFDMNVLKGAQGMMEKRGIRLIVVEAGMYAGNTRHVPFLDLHAYLEGLGFVLFGMYDQCREWTLDLPYLRRADLAFVQK